MGSSRSYNPEDDIEEVDPDGKDPHTGGAKLDHGKIRPTLVFTSFARALWQVCEVGTYGANKYTDDGWIDVDNAYTRYTDAQLRHFLKQAIGEDCDKDSRLLHLSHEAWNALCRLELYLREKDGN